MSPSSPCSTGCSRWASQLSRLWKVQLHSQEKDPVRKTGTGLLEGNTLKSNVHLQGDAYTAPITWNKFRKLKQSASGWENFHFSSVVTKSMKMRLSGFSRLGLLNMIPPWEQALLVFAAASSCSPTMRADMPVSVCNARHKSLFSPKKQP